MARTHRMITNAGDGTVTSASIFPQRSKDETGIIQVQRSAIGVDWGTGMLLQGRVAGTDAWFTITSFVNADFVAPNTLTIAEVIQLMPEMRVVSTGQTGGGTSNVWLVE